MLCRSFRAVLRKESWMFCCAGLASICRSPFSFEPRHELRGGQLARPACRPLQYGLGPCFSTYCQIINNSRTIPAFTAPDGLFPSLLRRSPDKNRAVPFPPAAIYNRQFQRQASLRSPAIDRNQLPHRLQYQPSDVVSLAAFYRRHYLDWLVVLLQSRECSVHEGT